MPGSCTNLSMDVPRPALREMMCLGAVEEGLPEIQHEESLRRSKYPLKASPHQTGRRTGEAPQI